MYEWTSCHVMNERGHCTAQVFARCLCGEKWSAVLSRHWTSFCCVFPLHYCVWSTELSLKVGHLWYMLYRCVIPYTLKFRRVVLKVEKVFQNFTTPSFLWFWFYNLGQHSAHTVLTRVTQLHVVLRFQFCKCRPTFETCKIYSTAKIHLI